MSRWASLRGGDWLIRLEVEPSFEPTSSIGILRQTLPEGNHSYRIVYRVRRERPAATGILGSIKALICGGHSIIERTADAPAALVQTLTAQLASLPLAELNEQPPIGLDGTTYSLFVQANGMKAWGSWWCDEPKEWRPVMSWYSATWKLLAVAVGLSLATDAPEFHWEERKLGIRSVHTEPS